MPLQLTIIGAGPGGYVAAVRAAQLGAAVTLIEDREVGGTCLNHGCIPTKTIIASTELYLHIRNAAEYGIASTGEARMDLDRLRARKDAVVATQVRGIRELLKSWNVRFIAGRGSLLGRDAVRAVQPDGTTMDIRSDRIILATGSRPASLPGLELDGTRILSSDDALRLTAVPKRLLIVGGGVIGCEFAFIYQALGADVTVVEMAERALPSEDEDVSAVIEREFKKAKIKFHPGSKIEALHPASDGVSAKLSSGIEVAADQVLVSIGRAFNSGGLGLEKAGVATGERGEITVNERMETGVPGIFAIGDVTGRLMLAHVASHQGLVAAENALGGKKVMNYAAVPAGIFTRPEIGSVGLREHQARERGIEVRTGKFPFRALGRAHAAGEIVGMAKVISDAAEGRVLGVHIVGAHAADLVHEAALAITIKATARQLADMVHAHPTFAEAIMEAAAECAGSAVHALRPKARTRQAE